MDQNKVFTKFLYEIKRVIVVILVLIAANSCAASETNNEPPSVVSPPPKTERKINATMVVILACLLTSFLLICILFTNFRHYAERQLALAATNGYGGGERTSMSLAATCGLDPAVIAAFTSFTYSTVKDIKIGQHVLECAVCLNEFHDHENLRLLPGCNHVFHRDCIDEWLTVHVTCQVCRASLVPKPSQLSHETELPCGLNAQIKDHVSVELVNLKHDLASSRILSRSCSMGHSMVKRSVESVDRYTLRLPDEVQNALRNTVNRTNMSLLPEGNLKKSVKSVSASFVRWSNYFNYKKFDEERPSGRWNFGITHSFNSCSGSGSSSSGFGSDLEDSARTSQRFLTSVRSPVNGLFQMSNKDTNIMIRLNDS
ncbi:hypothetical protein L1987_22629 [Smallanthus sonchifolius]|uniref:Uncharacterized protein n=1 Tax=Smallanthus sonchifolius TaxID=185202 RepID=A0ACB9IFC4_9ASTR|nr:hypothetical protein L1987_22629 [Smallanthus sonchifolius]